MDDTSTRYLNRPALVSSPPSLVFFLLFCCRARRESQTEEVRQGGDGGDGGGGRWWGRGSWEEEGESLKSLLRKLLTGSATRFSSLVLVFCQFYFDIFKVIYIFLFNSADGCKIFAHASFSREKLIFLKHIIRSQTCFLKEVKSQIFKLKTSSSDLVLLCYKIGGRFIRDRDILSVSFPECNSTAWANVSCLYSTLFTKLNTREQEYVTQSQWTNKQARKRSTACKII